MSVKKVYSCDKCGSVMLPDVVALEIEYLRFRKPGADNLATINGDYCSLNCLAEAIRGVFKELKL
jgi:hypothetical protein